MEGYVVVVRFFSHLLERPFPKDILVLLPCKSRDRHDGVRFRIHKELDHLRRVQLAKGHLARGAMVPRIQLVIGVFGG
jgi:hypothetical protein